MAWFYTRIYKIMEMDGTPNIHFICNANSSTESFPHFWTHTIGSCHAPMALRADWQKQLARCHNELGFRYVRFHGILSDDMSTLIEEKNLLTYSFFNADQICDFLLSIGMRPFVELSFMPLALASGSDAVFHYKGNITPPKDPDQWAIFIGKLVQHWVTRYGIDEVSQWFFEVWNEPNLTMFWAGTQTEYFNLYKHTAEAIKKIDGRLQVGGPATANNGWITDFTNYCAQNKVPVDFVSTHHYLTDYFRQPGDDAVEPDATATRSILRQKAEQTKKEAEGKPVHYTEWSSSSDPFDEMHDMPYTAAFIVKTVMEARGLVSGYSYWTFSDIFEENYFSSTPFHGGFGLMTIYGTPKSSYRAYQLLAGLGSELLAVAGAHDTADVWVTKNGRFIKVLITNWALPEQEIKKETISVYLDNCATIKTAFIERIDDDHANARKAWIEMGRPDSLSPAQVNTLELASTMVKEPFEVKQVQGRAILEVVIPAQGIVCITIETT